MRYPTEAVYINPCSQSKFSGNDSVVVLIAHHNDLDGLHRSLTSLRTEGGAVVVVDNASAKPPREKALRQDHPEIDRLHVINLAENIGTAQALNVGMAYA